MKYLAAIVNTLDQKKARNIQIINVSQSNPIAEYYIICDADNERQLEALANAIEDTLTTMNRNIHHIEGRKSKWVLVDASNIIIHIFHTSEREKYGLERLWSDHPRIDIEELLHYKGETQ